MIRAAVAGLGWWGKHIVRRMKDSDALRVVTAIEANDAQAGFAAEHGIAFTTDFAAVLLDPAIDAVILCTPHTMHTGQVLAVAAAGKHVFCEKPLALTRADAERSVQACRRAPAAAPRPSPARSAARGRSPASRRPCGRPRRSARRRRG